MSILSQARLTALSQKCVLVTAWRHDIREPGYRCIQNYSYYKNQERPRSEQQSKTTTTTTRGYCVTSYDATKPSLNCRCATINTPKLLHRLEPILNRTLVNKLGWDMDFNQRRTLLQTKWTPPFINYHGNDDAWQRYGDRTRSSNRHRRKNLKIIPLIGLMGLFKGMTTGDVEEEREKLSDEQRVKKMRPLELLIAKGVLSMCDQNYGKANELFHDALRLAQNENNEEQEVMILNLLASNYFESGDLDRAEKLFIELIKRMIAHGLEQTDLAILELSLKLASIYSKNQTTHDKATQGFKFVINNLLNNLQDLLNSVGEIEIQGISDDRKDELALLGWSYDWFAKHLLAMNDYTGAADMLQRALQISSKVLGPLHDQTLILLNDVGTTMAMNEAPEEGKTFIRKAVEGAIECQSKELASFYVNLGLVNLKLKKLNEAKRYCEYSIELASKNREHHNSYEVIQLSRSCLNEVERLLEVENQ